MTDNVTIVGASAAGLTAAETLRRSGWAGTITMIGGEEHLPYDRPPLSKELLSGRWPEDRLRLRDQAAIQALELDLRLGVRACALDSDSRKVQLHNGEQLGYDELIIATGVRPRTLPGTDNTAGVHRLRTLDDAQTLRDALITQPQVVVVGGGFLGAEVAAVARLAGCPVTLVCASSSPMADVLGDQLGSMLADVHSDHGVRVESAVRVADVTTKNGRADGVALTDGRRIDADLVVLAIGSVPETEWLADSGIDIDNGVRCDRFCRAAPGVWAAGDVASWEHIGYGERLRIEHRTNAAEQGMTVARNIIAGADAKPFTPVPYIWSDQYDLKIQIHGLARNAEVIEVTEGRTADRSLVALYGGGGRVRAAVGVNQIRATRQARRLVADHAEWPAVIGR